LVKEDSLRAAIIGCGGIAGGYDDKKSTIVRTHAKAYLVHSQTKLIAVADKDEQRAKDFSLRWDSPSFYTDIGKMLAEESPDIVSICTPTKSHADLLAMCLDFPSVKAVWLEKPLTFDIDRGAKIVRAYSQKNKILAVNYQRRWNPEMHRIKVAIKNRELGRIQKVVVYYSKGIENNGSHAIDLLLDWFGDITGIQVLSCLADFSEDDPTVDAILHFGDVLVYLIGVDSRNYGLFEMQIFSENCRINLKRFGREIEWIRRQENPEFEGYHELNPQGVVYETDASKVMTYVLENIVQSILVGQPIRSSGETALITLRECSKIIEQAKN